MTFRLLQKIHGNIENENNGPKHGNYSENILCLDCFMPSMICKLADYDIVLNRLLNTL